MMRVKILIIVMFLLIPLIQSVSANEAKNTSRQLPEPQGGAESTERVRQPVSNIILQQRYPETIVLRGAMSENKLALTFDDGPDPRFTSQVLDVLKKHDIKATFFVMGARAREYPDLVRRMIDDGHIVGNHSYTHPNFVEEEQLETLEREVNQTEDELEGIIGYRTKLFRAPYGFLYNELVEKLAEMDYTVVGWSVDSLDWQEDAPEVIAYTVTSNIHPGAIILMHDGGEWDADRTNTIRALDQLIPTLKAQGFQFETVPDLLNIPYKK
ncbi:polysaccharide deacetylase family protein [Bacillus sp. PS06]|uniref:polysaccharide deacetylase family protein n=1 Tax=Bacillus sp. PS06 TaxID=2764176 RepID=UPI003990C817